MNLTSEDMADLRHQGIAVNDDNDPAPKNIPDTKNIPLPQLEEENLWRSEGIICPSQSKQLHNKYAAFKNYSREELMKMTELELFLILFPVEYLKEILIPETNNLLKNPMDPVEFIRWMVYWLYMGCWVRISNRRNWWSTSNPTMSVGAPFILNKYIPRTRFEGVLGSLHCTDKKYVEYYDGFFHMPQIEEAWNLNMAE